MATRLLILVLFATISLDSPADFDKFRKQAIKTYENNSTKAKTGSLNVSPRFLEYEFEGKKYDGMMYNNEVVPSITIDGVKYPACINQEVIFKAKIRKNKLVCQLVYHANEVEIINKLADKKDPEAMQIKIKNEVIKECENNASDIDGCKINGTLVDKKTTNKIKKCDETKNKEECYRK